MLCSSYRLFKHIASCALLLASQVQASPLALNQRSIFEEASAAYAALKNARGLTQRDVVAPPILKPDASSVWPIGTIQEVIWDITNLPPDSQITNPIGRVILGRDTGDSLNLDLDNPLAEGFHIRQGRVNITVPNVPPRPDYLIVLMGNSGNTSPSFAITQIADDTNNSPSPSRPPVADPEPSLPGVSPTVSSQPAILSSTTITDPIPITGTTITGSWDTSIIEETEAPTNSFAPISTGSAPAPSESTGSDEPSPSSGDLTEDDSGAAVRTGLTTSLVVLVATAGVMLVGL
ncbi:hypothetical protein CC1G_05139 [Coprinopsis cinerea okayama7|uniref:Uncharacterized protein n=1 Tax=Coprinopsis cinerea (strain Okayama-7 / 130 / ATCC MYA-4618 / FGSC 9003) TaxID=240176 RepID=A8NFZ7_COPC7|nr:hypothetical protein CC1G_05139 [Coprinopsis cinerea okayama7\|eukprot:XP_001833439.1 hypothetical protein CC1G_05139 [Coprinopsis cinerea okayama7\